MEVRKEYGKDNKQEKEKKCQQKGKVRARKEGNSKTKMEREKKDEEQGKKKRR